jgi:hypothetical protein
MTGFASVLVYVVVTVVAVAMRRKGWLRGPPKAWRQPNFVPPRIVFLVLLGVPFSVAFLVTGSGLMFAMAAPFLLAACAPLAIAWVAIPRGLVRAAWALDRYTGGANRLVERRAASSLPAARAYLRRPTEEGARFLDDRLRACLQIGTSGATASALVVLARGDREYARVVLGAVEAMGEDAVPPALRIARDVLVVDAVARGDWRTAARLGESPRPSHLVRLWATVAKRVLGQPDPLSEATIRRAWRRVPARDRVKAAVDRALAIPPPPPPAPVAASLDAHVALLRLEPSCVRAEDIAAAALSLDALRGSAELRATLDRRALAAGAPGLGAPAFDAVMGDAEADLVSTVLAARAPGAWLPPGPTGDAVRDRVGEARMARAEALVTELQRRTRERKDLPEADEWRAWGDARDACAQVWRDAGNPAKREAIFRTVYPPLCNYAVRMSNVRARRVLAAEIFRYLFGLSEVAGSEETRRLLGGNVVACRSETLPRVVTLEGERMSVAQPANVAMAASFAFAVAMTTMCVSGKELGLSDDWVSFGALLGLVVVGIGFILLRRRMVEGAWTPDGLQLQSAVGRFYAPREDVTLRHGPGRLIRVHLRRAPSWLPRRAFAIALRGARH